MFKISKLCGTIFAIFFSIYWFVVCPLLWVFVKPRVIENGILDRMQISLAWTPFIFWGGALIIFIAIVIILWCIIFCGRKGHRHLHVISDVDSKVLDSVKIHDEGNRNVKDRVAGDEMKMAPTTTDAYRDIQNTFRQGTNFKPTLRISDATTQTTSRNTATTSETTTGRLNSCDRCSKLITDEEMVNIFVNKKVVGGSDNYNGLGDAKVGFEVVGKSVPQAMRFRIDENVSPNDDRLKQTKSDFGLTKTAHPPGKSIVHEAKSSNISIPVRRDSTLKSEVFIVVNNDCSFKEEAENDDVFK